MNFHLQTLAVLSASSATPISSAFKLLSAILVFSALALPAHAQKKKDSLNITRHPDMLIDVTDIKVSAPQQKCENWAWAAAVESTLRVLKISDLNQAYWIDRANGGRCEENAPTLEETAHLLTGDYLTPAGHSFHIDATAVAGAPVLMDDILASLRQGRAPMLYWRSHAYVLSGVVFDEAIYPNGSKLFEARELWLRDPLKPADPTIKFVRGTDDPGDIGGVLLVKVVEGAER